MSSFCQVLVADSLSTSSSGRSFSKWMLKGSVHKKMVIVPQMCSVKSAKGLQQQNCTAPVISYVPTLLFKKQLTQQGLINTYCYPVSVSLFSLVPLVDAAVKPKLPRAQILRCIYHQRTQQNTHTHTLTVSLLYMHTPTQVRCTEM